MTKCCVLMFHPWVREGVVVHLRGGVAIASRHGGRSPADRPPGRAWACAPGLEHICARREKWQSDATRILETNIMGTPKFCAHDFATRVRKSQANAAMNKESRGECRQAQR